MRLAFFAALLVACCVYALWRGGQPERVVGATLLIAYAASLATYSSLSGRFTHVETGILIVDGLLMLVLLLVALRADRGWTFGVAGLHLATLGAHFVRILDAEMFRVTYAVMIACWSYPMLALLAIGTWRHRRRLLLHGCDLDWSVPTAASPDQTEHVRA